MILAPKIFLGQCVAYPIAGRLLNYYKQAHPSITVRHLSEEYRQSRCDSVVAFTGALGNAKASKHQEALDEVMRNIGPIYQAKAGTIIKLGMDFSKGGIKRYALRVGQRSLGIFLETSVRC